MRTSFAFLLLPLFFLGCKNGALDADEDGFTTLTDCDDHDTQINPGIPELCDGIDNDCDGQIDEEQAEDALIWFRDADGDGYGDPANPQAACHIPHGYVANELDCNDRDPTFHPGAQEPDCTNDTDFNCDGSVGYADADGDGEPACTACDDSDSHVGSGITWYADADGDGFGGSQFFVNECTAPVGYVDNNDDCNDLEPVVFPSATEICDELDNDCDGGVDELVTSVFFQDLDADGYGDPNTTLAACDAPSGYVANDSDCNDADSTVSPASLEFCDNRDNNCDSVVDEDSAVDAPTWFHDADKDDYGDPNAPQAACTAPTDHVADNTDCDDDDGSIHPGAEDTPEDGIDQDCDGTDALSSSAAGGYLGDLAISTTAEMGAFCQLYDRIYGNLTIDSTSLTSLSGLSCLTEIHGNFRVENNASLATLQLPDLDLLGGNVELNANPALSYIELGTATEVNGGLSIVELGAITNLDDFAALTDVGGSLLISDNISVNDVTGLHGLTRVGGNFGVIDNTALTTSDAVTLRDTIGVGNIGGTVTISGNAP